MVRSEGPNPSSTMFSFSSSIEMYGVPQHSNLVRQRCVANKAGKVRISVRVRVRVLRTKGRHRRVNNDPKNDTARTRARAARERVVSAIRVTVSICAITHSSSRSSKMDNNSSSTRLLKPATKLPICFRARPAGFWLSLPPSRTRASWSKYRFLFASVTSVFAPARWKHVRQRLTEPQVKARRGIQMLQIMRYYGEKLCQACLLFGFLTVWLKFNSLQKPGWI